MSRPPVQSLRAFTLVELLVSSALLGLLMFVLLGTMNTSLDIWRNAESGVTVDREGRTALGILARDFNNILVPKDSDFQPRLAYSTAEPEFPFSFLLTVPSDLQDAATGDTGEVCFVQYRLKDNHLWRAFIGSKDTFAALRSDKLPTPELADYELVAKNILSLKAWGSDKNNLSLATPADPPAALPHNLDILIEVLDDKLFKIWKSGMQVDLQKVGGDQQYFQTRFRIPEPKS